MFALRSLNTRVLKSRTFQQIVRWEHASLAQFTFSDVIKKNLRLMGITSLFPVQEKTIPSLLNGRDVICRSKTGSGKTLAFAIPIIDKILKIGRKRNPIALILTPTRELAVQVRDEFSRLDPSIVCVGVYGGVSSVPQVQALRNGASVVVGTPGRVMDLMESGSLNLDDIEFFVLDEADRMLEIGFDKDVEFIFSNLPEKKQALLFSATIPKWIHQMQSRYLKNSEFFDMIGDEIGLPESMENFAVSVSTDTVRSKALKNILLSKVTRETRVLIFTETKVETDDISNIGGLGSITIDALHGDKSQSAREQILKSFKSGELNVLVSTDVAARGLDIPNVDYVIHYRLPKQAESFLHRSGRTARAGKSGKNIFFIDKSSSTRDLLDTLKRDFKLDFKWIPIPTVTTDEAIITKLHSKINSISSQNAHKFLDFARHLISSKGADGVAALAAYAGGSNDTTIYSTISGKPNHVTYSLRVLNSPPSSPKGWESLIDELSNINPELSKYKPFHFLKDELYFDAPLDSSEIMDKMIETLVTKSPNSYEFQVIEELPQEMRPLNPFYSDDSSSGSFHRYDRSNAGGSFGIRSNDSFGRNDRGSSGGSYGGRSNDSFGRNDRSSGSGSFGNRSNDSFGRNDRASSGGFSAGRSNDSFGRYDRSSGGGSFGGRSNDSLGRNDRASSGSLYGSRSNDRTGGSFGTSRSGGTSAAGDSDDFFSKSDRNSSRSFGSRSNDSFGKTNYNKKFENDDDDFFSPKERSSIKNKSDYSDESLLDLDELDFSSQFKK